MQRSDGDQGLEKRERPQESGPPTWLLAAGCTAMVLLIVVLIASGPIGEGVATWSYFTVLTLATVFFCLLAFQQGRRRSR